MSDKRVSEAKRSRCAPDLNEKSGFDRGIEDGCHIGLAGVEQFGHQVFAELDAEHGGRRQNHGSVSSNCPDPTPHDVTQARRNLRLVQLISAVDGELGEIILWNDAPRLDKMTDEMRGIERIARRLHPKMVNQFQRRRTKHAPGHRHSQIPKLSGVETEERDPTVVAAVEVGERGTKLVGGAFTNIAKADDQQHGRVDERSDTMTQEEQRGWLHPVQVIEDRHETFSRRLVHPVGDAANEVGHGCEEAVSLGGVVDRRRRHHRCRRPRV